MAGMIERVARALFESDYPNPGDIEEGSWETGRDGYLASARAAIEAMRDTTEEMRAAMNEDIDWDGDAVRAYLAGIDAALKEDA